MSVTTEPAAIQLKQFRERVHPKCVVCSQSNVNGLRLNFIRCARQSVQADFYCHDSLQGYQGCLHGGVVASLLDGAMANCMFTIPSPAVTIELNVRFLGPVLTGHPATVRASIQKSSPLLHILEAEIVQKGQVKATAEGKFMKPAPQPGAHQQDLAGK